MASHESAAKAKPKVAIIGAGLTGLLTAHGLKKNGFDVAVFEREPNLEARPRDWSILIHWAMPLMTKLLPEVILAKLPDAMCNPYLDYSDPDNTSVLCLNGTTGETMFKNSLPGARRVTRQKFRRVIAEGIDVNWGKSLSQLSASEDSVTLTFEDGETFEADYVLGADGPTSKTRELLLGAEAAQIVGAGFSMSTTIAKYGDVEKVKTLLEMNNIMTIYMGTTSTGGVGIMEADNSEDMSTWTIWWSKCWRGSSVMTQGQEALDYLKETSKDIIEPFKSAIDWTPDGSRCYIDQMKYWNPIPFPNPTGRVTLGGDACHPMLPFRGQGLQNAITDASNYIDALLKIQASDDPTSRKEVMAAYDAEMVARGAEAVRQSVQEAEKAFDINTVKTMLMMTKGHGRLDVDTAASK